ncbi:uncharacterized protein LOC135503247 [Lineus longissimus]|uniref:uncharacterized protein LOC135503247 n=1 Tax=Lineus longissimus TaxID=88925 RepID=UPI002B4ECDF3
MVSGRSCSPSMDKLHSNIIVGVLLVTILIGLSSADLADFYLRELRQASSEDSEAGVCDGAILKGGPCGLERDNCCGPLQCARFNMFRRRWSACPSSTKSNSHCRCIYVRPVAKRVFPNSNFDLDENWSDNSSPYY